MTPEFEAFRNRPRPKQPKRPGIELAPQHEAMLRRLCTRTGMPPAAALGQILEAFATVGQGIGMVQVLHAMAFGPDPGAEPPTGADAQDPPSPAEREEPGLPSEEFLNSLKGPGE